MLLEPLFALVGLAARHLPTILSIVSTQLRHRQDLDVQRLKYEYKIDKVELEADAEDRRDARAALQTPGSRRLYYGVAVATIGLWVVFKTTLFITAYHHHGLFSDQPDVTQLAAAWTSNDYAVLFTILGYAVGGFVRPGGRPIGESSS